jgi:hypothetical protein
VALSTKVAAFTWLSTDPAGTTYDVTLGFQPKLVFVYHLGSASSTDTVGRGSARMSFGAAKDGTTRAASGLHSSDANTNQVYIGWHSTTAVALQATGTLDVDAVANWPSDGIRFVVDIQSSATVRVGVLALGGSDLTAVTVGSFQEPGATGNQTIAHGLGATPTGVIFFTGGLATAPPATATTGPMCLTLGAYDGASSWVITQFGDDGATSSTNCSYVVNTQVLAMGLEGVTLNARATAVSLDATNITINWAARAATRYIFYAAWVGGLFDCGSVSTRTDTTPFTGPTAGFVPKASLFASAARPASVTNDPTGHGQLSLGLATSASERLAQSMIDVTGLLNTQVSTALETDAVYARISTDVTPAIAALMDVTNMAVDPMALVMDAADPSASLVLMASWGGLAGAPPGPISDLNATAVSSTQVNLTWTAATDAASHRIERSTVG